MNTQITTTQTLGSNEEVFEIEASADIKTYSNNNEYEIENNQYVITHNGNILTGDMYDWAFNRLDLDAIDDLLIEQIEG